jgi:hypothetical protein
MLRRASATRRLTRVASSVTPPPGVNSPAESWWARRRAGSPGPRRRPGSRRRNQSRLPLQGHVGRLSSEAAATLQASIGLPPPNATSAFGADPLGLGHEGPHRTCGHTLPDAREHAGVRAHRRRDALEERRGAQCFAGRDQRVVADDVGLHIGWRHQTHGVSKCLKLTCPMVR